VSAVIPKRTWALISVIFIAAVLVFLRLVFTGAMGSLEERYYRLEVPGSMELPHMGAGHYYVFHQFDKSRDSKEDIRPAGIERLDMTLTALSDGEQVKLNRVGEPLRFVIRRTVCDAVYEFDVKNPGGYRFNADYPQGVTGGTYRVALGEPYFNQTLRKFLLGCVVLVAAGGVVSFLLFRASKRAEAAAGLTHG